jgi:hypothetical protein
MRLRTRFYLAYEITIFITLRVQSYVRDRKININNDLMKCEACRKWKCSVIRKIFFKTNCSCPADRPWANISSIYGKGKVFDFKLSRCSKYCVSSLSFGWFPGFWILCILPAYIAYEDGTESVPKRRHMKFRCRGIIHKKEHNQCKVVCRHTMNVCGGME